MVELIKPTQEAVEAWLGVVTGEFHYTKACDGIFDRSQHPHLRMIFQRARVKGIIEPVGNRDGWWRAVQQQAQPIDWINHAAHSDSELALPFDLRKWVFIYPDTTTIIAGSKSSGKTGFLYRTVVLNMNGKRKVKLLTNLEGGIGMLRDRFITMGEDIKNPPQFDVIPVYENHHDYIKDPETLYIIDYIDCPDGESFYKIAHYIKRIDQKLQGLNSLAVIGLQKPSGRDVAFGGEQTLKVATLYLAVDTGKLKIVDAKVSALERIYPKNMQWTFKYEESGTKFTDIQPYYGGT